MGRLIFHVDVNSAFLSWEAAYRLHHMGGQLDLRSIPSAVSGDMAARHGIILAKAVPAKKYGVKTGETIGEARRKCPSLYMVPPNYGLYQRCSAAFVTVLRTYSPAVEQYSIDECFVDMSGIEAAERDPVRAADELRERIRRELGFTVNVGISDNKLLAKMASDFRKPDRTHTLFRREVPEKMWPLPVSDLFYVGHATARKLAGLGICTIGDLAHADPDLLRAQMGKQGELIHAFANGADVSPVETEAPPQKGYGNSTTIAFDVADASTAKLVLLALCETVGARLRRHRMAARRISVGIRSFDLSYAGHQMQMPNATNITNELHRYACQLFDELWDGRPIRHLSVSTGRLVTAQQSRQMELFDHTDYRKLALSDEAADRIRARYGIDALRRASFIGSRIDHMEGGISREKRDVDYTKQKID